MTTAGAKTFRAFADGNCATLESNEANNQKTLSYRVRGTQPDFVVSAITLSPASPAANKTFTATVTIKNQGTAAGTVGYLDVWTDQPSAQDCGSEGDAWAGIGSLSPGVSKTVSLKLIAGASGAKTLRAFADSWCGTAEANDNNNQTTKGYTVP